MSALGLESHVVDTEVRATCVRRFRERGIVLPTFRQLASPDTISAEVRNGLASVGPDDAHPANLFRVHWQNADDRRGTVPVPAHLELPESLTGVPARIVVLLGNRFPLIRAHKVLAAYGCLVPRLVTGQFDPTRHRAVWPSTGNYCRGGVAISRILGCRGVAVLPEGMSEERFRWLADWVTSPEDVIKTPGSESNVKEIYDRCAELRQDPGNVIFNQFQEFGNHLAHRTCTGPAVERVMKALAAENPSLTPRAFVSASGSAGTLGAGNHLKARLGCKVVVGEALECPTLSYNGFGEHNIQGIGDKHVPFIHDVMNTDVVSAVSETATDELDVLFNTDVGRRYLVDRRRVPEVVVNALGDLGFSSICNIISAIKAARYFGWGESDIVLTVATDGAELYESERRQTLERRFNHGFDEIDAAEVFGRHLLGAATDHLAELSTRDRERIYNLGYFTWVEQQGVSLDDFVQRRERSFWHALTDLVPAWDEMIEAFNDETASSS